MSNGNGAKELMMKTLDDAIAASDQPVAENACKHHDSIRIGINTLLRCKRSEMKEGVPCKPNAPSTWNECAKLFVVKAPVPFSLIVVALICWFMYSNVKPKEVLPVIAKEAVAHVEE